MSGRLYEDYFDLQLRVATAYAQLGGLTRSTAIARFTNLRRRFGLADESGTAEWEGFLHSVPEDAEHEELLARTLEWYEHRPTRSASPFGCFSYDPPDAHGILRIHFMPEEQHRRDSPLSDARISERRSELQAMIADVRHRYSNVRHVRGVSWLYNVQAYRQLFPSEYVASITLPTFAVSMNGSSTWGQALDYRHKVKTDVRDHVLANVNATTLSVPWRAFPLPALVAACVIECFPF